MLKKYLITLIVSLSFASRTDAFLGIFVAKLITSIRDREKIRLEDHQKRMDQFIGDDKEMKKFVEANSLPANEYKEFVKDEKKVYYRHVGVYNTPSQQYFLKGDSDVDGRITNANRMNTYIEQKGYTTVAAPKKYIFLAGNQWITIAERIECTKSNEPLTLTQAQELTDVVTELGYSDLTFGENILQNNKGQSVTVDTERESFASPSWEYTYRDKALNGWNLRNYIYGRFGATDEAKAWLDKTAGGLRAQYEHSTERFVGRISDESLDKHPVDTEVVHAHLNNHKKTKSYNDDFFGEKERFEEKIDMEALAAAIRAELLRPS